MKGIARMMVCAVLVLGLAAAPVVASAGLERGEGADTGWVDGFLGWLLSVVTAGDGDEDDDDRGPEVDPNGVVGVPACVDLACAAEAGGGPPRGPEVDPNG